jgi:hypothetical protein
VSFQFVAASKSERDDDNDLVDRINKKKLTSRSIDNGKVLLLHCETGNGQKSIFTVSF